MAKNKGKGRAHPNGPPAPASSSTGTANVVSGASSASGSASASAIVSALATSSSSSVLPSAPIRPLGNPSAGSANPAASFPALWNYLEPALEHIMRGPTNDPKRSPPLDVAYHMGIHTAVYNYFTTSRFDVGGLAAASAASSPSSSTDHDRDLIEGSSGGGKWKNSAQTQAHGADLYAQLDKYYAVVCRELLAHAPAADAELLPYLLPTFARYAAGAASVHRLLNYVNRHFVKRAVEEDRGWLRLADVLESVAQTVREVDAQLTAQLNGDARAVGGGHGHGHKYGHGHANVARSAAIALAKAERARNRHASSSGDLDDDLDDDEAGGAPRGKIAARLREARELELKKWGFVDGASPEELRRAEAAAEAASAPDRVVPLDSMAHRRFREEVVKPLLAVPKAKKGGKKKYKKPPGVATPGSAAAAAAGGANALDIEPPGPKSRLARAVKELIESKDAESEDERRRMAVQLNDALALIGIPNDHVLRRKLDKFSGTRLKS